MKGGKISGGKISEEKLVAFEELFKLFYPRLKKYAESFLGNSGEAEDLVQDVFYHYWQNAQFIDDEKQAGSFLYTTVKNRCLNLLKHRLVEDKFALNKINFESEELYHISFLDQEEYSSMEEKLAEEMGKIIAEMPPKCGEAFRLKWLEGKKIREIAAVMNISTTMVDKHLAKGLKIARAKLNPELFIFFLFSFMKE